MLRVLASILFMWILVLPALPQQAETTSGEETVTGRVVSSTRNTVTVRTQDGRYQLFVLDNYTAKPDTILTGSTVRVLAAAGGDESGARVARAVTVVSAGPAAEAPGAQAEADAIPTSVRTLERDIERSVRKYGVGVRGGVGLDPELVMLGLQANLGSLFSNRISLRPSAEFAWGEVTNMVAINLEALYRLPISPARGRWSAYVGGGPGFFFSDQNFERAAEGDRDINFDDFDFNAGLNVFTGIEFRNGFFMEAKTTVYASPHLRLIVGYNF
jgi:hypothetical protein